MVTKSGTRPSRTTAPRGHHNFLEPLTQNQRTQSFQSAYLFGEVCSSLENHGGSCSFTAEDFRFEGHSMRNVFHVVYTFKLNSFQRERGVSRCCWTSL